MSKKHKKHKYNKEDTVQKAIQTQVMQAQAIQAQAIQAQAISECDNIAEGDRVLVVYEENSCVTEQQGKDQLFCYIPYANIKIPIPSYLNKLCFKHIREATFIKIIKERESSCCGYATYNTYALIEYYNPSRVYERVPIDCVYKISDKDKADLECTRNNFKVLTNICFNLIHDLQRMQNAYSKTQNELNARITALEKKYAE